MNHSPFKFLEAYNAQDKHLFFGRNQEIETLFNLTFRSRFILVYGPSGTGKTSLIRSGLAKKLSDTDWFSVYIRRKQNINTSLREELAKWNKGPNNRNVAEQVRYVSLLYLRPVYLLFDQLEELFISGDTQEQYEFLQSLILLYQSDAPCKIILSMREEYLAHLYSFEEALPTLFDYRLRVEQMGDERIKEVIIDTFDALPLVKLEEPDGCAEAIVENLKESNKLIQLPYLQVYLDRLWNNAIDSQKPNKDTDIVISKTIIEDVGRIDEVLEDYLEEQITKVQFEFPELQEHPGYIRKLLDSFVTSGGTRKNVIVANLPDDQDKALRIKLLKELEKRRILREDNGSYEFYHDSLAGVIFKKRSTEQKRLTTLIRRLKQAFSDYEGNEQNADFFLNKLSSQEFRVNEIGLREELSETEFQQIADFVRKGEQYRQSERLSKEIEKRKRRQILLNLSILLTVVVIFGSLSILQWQKSLVSNLVSLSSNLILKSNPEEALSLAWQAHQTLPTPSTERALYSAFNQYDSPEQWTEILTKKIEPQPIQSIRVAADDQSILILKSEAVEIRNMTGKLLTKLSTPQGFKYVDLSPNSPTILTISNDSITQLWNINGRIIATLPLKFPVAAAFFLPAVNPLLITVSNKDEVNTWTLEGKPLYRFRHGAPVTKLFFSADGQQVFTISANKIMKVWDTTGRLIHTITFPSYPSKVVCSPTNDYCAAILQDSTVQTWSMKQPKLLIPLKKNQSKVLDMAFEADGSTLVIIEDDFIISRWNMVRKGNWTMENNLISQNKFDFPNTNCRLSPDANWLVNEAENSMPSTLFNIKGEAIKALFNEESHWVFSPSSKLIVAIEKNKNRLRIWERRGQLRATLTEHIDAVYKAAFTADSLYLLTASADGQTQKWDFNQRKLVAQYKYDDIVRDIATPRFGTWLVCFGNKARFKNRNGISHDLIHKGDVLSGVISPDGRFALTASEDHNAILWDENGDSVKVFKHNKAVNRAIFSPDGKYILTACGDSTARLWSRKNYDLQQTFSHQAAISDATFSPNFKKPLIVTTSADSTAKIWDLNGDQWLILRHNDFVSSAAISADNKSILTTTNSGIAQLWNNNGELKGVFDAYSPIYHSLFSPNEQSVILACENGNVQIWPTLKNIERWANKEHVLLDKDHITLLKQKHQVADNVWDDFIFLLTDSYQKSSIKLKNWYRQLKRFFNS